MDRLFVANIEDKEVLFESCRDRENVRSEGEAAACGTDSNPAADGLSDRNGV